MTPEEKDRLIRLAFERIGEYRGGSGGAWIARKMIEVLDGTITADDFETLTRMLEDGQGPGGATIG